MNVLQKLESHARRAGARCRLADGVVGEVHEGRHVFAELDGQDGMEALGRMAALGPLQVSRNADGSVPKAGPGAKPSEGR